MKIAGVFPVLCAATRVANNVKASILTFNNTNQSITQYLFLKDTMKTKAWTSELMFQLCCNNNVSVAFRAFGISDKTTTILVALLDAYERWLLFVFFDLFVFLTTSCSVYVRVATSRVSPL
jgi:hypothetical protein